VHGQSYSIRSSRSLEICFEDAFGNINAASGKNAPHFIFIVRANAFKAVVGESFGWIRPWHGGWPADGNPRYTLRGCSAGANERKRQAIERRVRACKCFTLLPLNLGWYRVIVGNGPKTFSTPLIRTPDKTNCIHRQRNVTDGG
jgi:hypothetical protein